MRVERFGANPIIRPHMDGRMGDNINGPSLVTAPPWVKQPLGKYYLYFGHHRGTYIRLAFADDLAGPWRMHQPGVLDLTETPFEHHIASPDVHVDEARREVRLYFHGRLRPDERASSGDQQRQLGDGAQASRVAVSSDGLHFRVLPEVLGAPYFRVFQWQGWHFALGMPGILSRSRDGLTGFEPGHNPFAEVAPGMRHAAFLRDDNVLFVFYSNRGDCPERILVSRIDLTDEWTRWRASSADVVLEPELPYEGADLPQLPSRSGPIDVPVRQLRDPGIFREAGKDYLLYSVAGEQGLAIGHLIR